MLTTPRAPDYGNFNKTEALPPEARSTSAWLPAPPAGASPIDRARFYAATLDAEVQRNVGLLRGLVETPGADIEHIRRLRGLISADYVSWGFWVGRYLRLVRRQARDRARDLGGARPAEGRVQGAGGGTPATPSPAPAVEAYSGPSPHSASSGSSSDGVAPARGPAADAIKGAGGGR